MAAGCILTQKLGAKLEIPEPPEIGSRQEAKMDMLRVHSRTSHCFEEVAIRE